MATWYAQNSDSWDRVEWRSAANGTGTLGDGGGTGNTADLNGHAVSLDGYPPTSGEPTTITDSSNSNGSPTGLLYASATAAVTIHAMLTRVIFGTGTFPAEADTEAGIAYGPGSGDGLVGTLSVSATVAGRYHNRTDIENIWGARNVAIFADLDNDQDADKIALRIASVIARTESYVDSVLIGGDYAIPLTGTIPLEIVDICCYLSGYKLYEPRAMSDLMGGKEGDATVQATASGRRKLAERMLAQILSGAISLSTTSENSTTIPVFHRGDVMQMRQLRAADYLTPEDASEL